MKYYFIDEKLAKEARSIWSMSDYVAGTTTEDYKRQVNSCYELANICPDHSREKALYYADIFAKKWAYNINKSNRIELMCPSVLISGGANFNNRAKDKQNSARGRNIEERITIFEYINKIKQLQTAPEPKKQIIPNSTEEKTNYTVVYNYDVDRIQLIFADKPDDETRSLLKSNGFRWSPRFGAWQRQLTENAINSFRNLQIQLDT